VGRVGQAPDQGIHSLAPLKHSRARCPPGGSSTPRLRLLDASLPRYARPPTQLDLAR
jgi:hypothetical protein